MQLAAIRKRKDKDILQLLRRSSSTQRTANEHMSCRMKNSTTTSLTKQLTTCRVCLVIWKILIPTGLKWRFLKATQKTGKTWGSLIRDTSAIETFWASQRKCKWTPAARGQWTRLWRLASRQTWSRSFTARALLIAWSQTWTKITCRATQISKTLTATSNRCSKKTPLSWK